MQDTDQASLDAARDIIELEGVLLDEQRWDEWLALYTEDCIYWMPAWKSDDELTADPRTELSHIYYVDRAALEDRIVRVTSNLSPASIPMPRTTHMYSGIRRRDETGAAGDGDGGLAMRASWATHVYWPQPKQSHTFFGRADYDLVAPERRGGGRWRIARKVIVLQNDYIPSMIDFYCL